MKYRTSVAFRTALVTLDDRVEFALERSQAEDDLPGAGQRWTVTATLAGREFERTAIDIGFTTEPVLKPDTLTSSHLLDFADIAPVRVPTIAIEQHIAEKLHAYTNLCSRRAQLAGQGPRRPRRDRQHHHDRSRSTDTRDQ